MRNSNQWVLSVVAVMLTATAVLLLPGICRAETISGLAVEDLSSGSAVPVMTDFTIVEWDGFDDGDDPGNTVNTSTGGYFSAPAQGAEGLFWRRVNQGIPPNWTGLGGTNQRYRGESSGVPNNAGDPDGFAQNTTTITGLDANTTYNLYYIAGGRVNDTRAYTADFGESATTSRSAAMNLLHIAGLGDDPFANNLGFYAVPIGTTAGGTTTETVSLDATDGSYWLGVGYQPAEVIPEPGTIVMLLAGLALFVWRRR